MLKATYSDLDRKIHKGKVPAVPKPYGPSTALKMRMSDGRPMPSAHSKTWFEQWLSVLLKAFPQAPQDWILAEEKCNVTQHHVYLLLEKPGSRIPQPVLNKKTGEIDVIYTETDQVVSFMVKRV